MIDGTAGDHQRILEVLTVPDLPRSGAGGDDGAAAAVLAPTYEALCQALAGERTLLPVPETDRHRREALLSTMRPGEAIDPAVALVVATSGSTGTPKGAQLGVKGLRASIAATHHTLGGEGRWMLTLPAHHIAGLQVMTRSLVCGYEPLVMPGGRGESFVRRFVETVEAGQRGRQPARYCSLVPSQLDALYTAATTFSAPSAGGSVKACAQRVHDAMLSFGGVLVGGAATPASLLESARALGWKLVTTYGSSETCGGMVYNQRPLPGGAVSLASPEAATPAHDGHTAQFTAENPGRIWLGGPMVALGYRNVESDDFAVPGWFRTNDLGYVDAAGRVHVVGRADAVINSGSVKVLPSVVEEAARQAGIPVVLVCGVPSQRWGESVCLIVQEPEGVMRGAASMQETESVVRGATTMQRVDAVQETENVQRADAVQGADAAVKSEITAEQRENTLLSTTSRVTTPNRSAEGGPSETPRMLTARELENLRSALAAYLPRHALPTAAVAVAEVPMLNGMKVDRIALIQEARRAAESAAS